MLRNGSRNCRVDNNSVGNFMVSKSVTVSLSSASSAQRFGQQPIVPSLWSTRLDATITYKLLFKISSSVCAVQLLFELFLLPLLVLHLLSACSCHRQIHSEPLEYLIYLIYLNKDYIVLKHQRLCRVYSFWVSKLTIPIR